MYVLVFLSVPEYLLLSFWSGNIHCRGRLRGIVNKTEVLKQKPFTQCQRRTFAMLQCCRTCFAASKKCTRRTESHGMSWRFWKEVHGSTLFRPLVKTKRRKRSTHDAWDLASLCLQERTISATVFINWSPVYLQVSRVTAPETDATIAFPLQVHVRPADSSSMLEFKDSCLSQSLWCQACKNIWIEITDW